MEHHLLVINSPMRMPEYSFKSTYLMNVSQTEMLPYLEEATIFAMANMPLTYEILKKHAPKLQLILCLGTGTDHVDHKACRELGITLCNNPAQNIESVCEHAFALLAGLKRQIVPLHALTIDGRTWEAKKNIPIDIWEQMPRTNKDEILGVIGYGSLGKAIEKMAIALGMKVLIAEHKGVDKIRPGRTHFREVLQQCTILILAAPLDDSTLKTIDEAELAMMQKSAMLINVGRGALVNEAAIAQALRDKRIGGAATDVYTAEPATKENSPLLDPTIPNLLLSPHVAWYSKTTIDGAKKTAYETIEQFVEGKPRYVIVEGRRGKQ